MFRPNTPTPPPHRAWLIALLLLSLAIRLGWSFSRSVDEEAMFRSLPDQREYLHLSRNLLEGNGLRFVDLRFSDEVRAFRPAGYPILIALCGGGVRAVQFVQSLIDTSTVLATVLLARRWLSERTSLLAGALVALNPFLAFFSSLILTETLFTALLAWGMVLMARSSVAGATAMRRDALWWSGVTLIALSAHVRPSAAVLAIVLGIGAVLARLRSVSPPRWYSIPTATSLLLLTVAVMAPWAIRNRVVLGQWVWTSTNDGFSLYDGLNGGADGSSDQSFVAAMPQLRVMGEVERSRYLAAAAWDWARDNPPRVFKLAAVKIGRMWSPVPLSSEYGGRRMYVVAAAGYALPFYLLLAVGVWRGGLPRAVKAFLLLPAIYFTLVHAISIGSLRYRIPIEPPLAVLAAAALARSSAGVTE